MDKFNSMNQFVYFHSIKGTHKVKDALINEAHDVGFFPVKPYLHYSVIDISIDEEKNHQLSVRNFFNNKEKLLEFLKENKSKDLVLFNYIPQILDHEDEIPNESLTQVTATDESPFNSSFGILGSCLLPYHQVYRQALEALKISLRLEKTVDEQKEVFLADFACTEFELTDRLINPRAMVDFIAFKFDATRADNKKAILEKIYVGSNNNRLRVGSNNKFFWATCMYSQDRGRRKERTGKIMGGNIMQIEFFGKTTPEIGVYPRLFIRPNRIDDLKENEVVTGKDLALSVRQDYLHLLYWNPELSTFSSPDPEPMGFRQRWSGKKTVSDIIAAQRTPSEKAYDQWLEEHPSDDGYWPGTPRRSSLSSRIVIGDMDLEVVVFRSKK